MEEMVRETIENLRAHFFSVDYVSSRKEAKELALGLIPSNARVGVGGSVTIRELGIIEELKNRGHTVYDHWQQGLSSEQILEIRIKHLTCDVFLSSVNAITRSGELVSMDGIGNRINAMNFGPRRVIIVAGVNKIVEDVPAALGRIKNVAAPQNARRFGAQVPCAVSGQCSDCDSPQRICRSILIMERRPSLTDIKVVLVGEKLGY